jgi:hypothetical protein
LGWSEGKRGQWDIRRDVGAYIKQHKGLDILSMGDEKPLGIWAEE